MTGRKIPWTHSRAIAHMMFNEVFGKERAHYKKQARKEDRHYQKSDLATIKKEVFEIWGI